MRIGDVKNGIAIGSLVLAAAAAPLVAGCSSSGANRTDGAMGQGGDSDASTSSKFVSANLVAESASRSCEQVKTGHIEATLQVDGLDGRDGPSTAKLTSDFDTEARQASMTIDGAGLIPSSGGMDGGSGGFSGEFLKGFDAPVHIVVDGDSIYVNWPPMAQFTGMSTPWVQIPSMSMVESVNSVEGTTNCDFMDALSAVGGQVAEVGQEDVAGVPTTRYSGKVDVAAALDDLPADKRVAVDKALDRFGRAPADIPIEVWIDQDGIARRFVASYPMERAGQEGAGTATVTVELSHVGDPAVIEIPPADQVGRFDVEAMIGRFMGGGTAHD